ncbi:holo-ACP synthase [Chloroflexota bacterium]
MTSSSIVPVGVDIVEISRIRRAVSKWPHAFLERVYTKPEIQYCNNVASRLAARFAAKEAVMKALGTGAKGISWHDIEVTSNSNGAPSIQPYGKAHDKAQENGIKEFSISVSHSKRYAVAFVIGNVI